MSDAFAALSLGRIQHGASLRDMVEAAVANAIITGDMRPGEVVSAPTLAVEFGVSVTPVREAMMNLEKRGFVAILRNKGFRVTEVSEDDLTKIVEVRRLLEPPSMRRLAGRYPGLSERHAEFRGLAAQTLAAATAGELSEYVALDYDFHLGLLACLGNERLTDIVSDLRNQTRLVGLASLRDSDALVTTTEEHETLLDLLERGEAEAAESLMHRHVGHVAGQWSGHDEIVSDDVADPAPRARR